jgi:hypothetical protein
MFVRGWTTISVFIIYSTLNNEHSWEDLCIQLRNQQICMCWLSYPIKGKSDPLLMFPCKFANMTQVCCVNLFSRSRRLWKMNRITPTYLTPTSFMTLYTRYDEMTRNPNPCCSYFHYTFSIVIIILGSIP